MQTRSNFEEGPEKKMRFEIMLNFMEGVGGVKIIIYVLKK
jgi:hypothetical protein